MRCVYVPTRIACSQVPDAAVAMMMEQDGARTPSFIGTRQIKSHKVLSVIADPGPLPSALGLIRGVREVARPRGFQPANSIQGGWGRVGLGLTTEKAISGCAYSVTSRLQPGSSRACAGWPTMNYPRLCRSRGRIVSVACFMAVSKGRCCALCRLSHRDPWQVLPAVVGDTVASANTAVACPIWGAAADITWALGGAGTPCGELHFRRRVRPELVRTCIQTS